MPPTERQHDGFDDDPILVPMTKQRPVLQTHSPTLDEPDCLTPSTIDWDGKDLTRDISPMSPPDGRAGEQMTSTSAVRVQDNSSVKSHWYNRADGEKVMIDPSNIHHQEPAQPSRSSISSMDDDILGIVLRDAPFHCRRVCKQWHALVYAHILSLVCPRPDTADRGAVSRLACLLLKRDKYGHAFFRQLSTVHIGGELPVGLSLEAQRLLAQSSSIQGFQLNTAVLPVQELTGRHRVKKVDLSSMELTTPDMGVVGTMVQSNTTIETLKLQDLPIPVQEVRRGTDEGGFVKQMQEFLCGIFDASIIGSCMKDNEVTTDCMLNEVTMPVQQLQGRSDSPMLCNLSAMSLVDEHAAFVGAMVRDNSSATALSLYDNRIGDDGIAAFVENFRLNGQVTKLFLGDNQVDNEGAAALAICLSDPECKLATLGLSGNRISDQGISALAEGIKLSSCLQVIGLGANRISDTGAAALADAIMQCTSMVNLSLYNNSIGDQGAQALASILPRNERFAALELGYNQIGDTGARALATGVSWSAGLHCLSLNNNEVGDKGATALADALLQSTTLVTLCLDSNRVHDSGATALGRSLKRNDHLQELWLGSANGSGNCITDSGAREIALGITRNTTLAELWLGGNRFGSNGRTVLELNAPPQLSVYF